MKFTSISPDTAKLLRAVVLCLASSYAAGLASAQPVEFQPLGFLPNGVNSSARAISADGTTVVGQARVGDDQEAFRWTDAEGMIGLGFLPGGGGFSQAYGVSGDGTVVVGRSDSTHGERGFRWENGAMMILQGAIGSPDTRAFGISESGMRICGQAGGNVTYWDSLVAQNILPCCSGRAISLDGLTIVGNSGDGPFRWSQQVGFNYLGGISEFDNLGEALGVSGNGDVVVGYTSDSELQEQPYVWTQRCGLEAIGSSSFDFNYGRCQAISADGKVVVGRVIIDDQGYGFIWDAINGIQRLDIILQSLGTSLNGWSISQATGISANGTFIAGTGENPITQNGEALRIVIPRLDTCLLADTNADSAVTVNDISGFVDALFIDWCDLSGQLRCACDLNGDETIDGKDIQPFITELLG